MLLLAALACGGDDKADDGTSTTSESGTTSSTTDEQYERCLQRCTRGQDGPGCDAAAIENACQNYCVDPPALPEACQDPYSAYQRCIAPVADFTCVDSPAQVGDVVVPVPADRYECALEAKELELCATIPDPGCVPTVSGAGATCALDLALCNAGGVTFDANVLCDGTICSMLVDSGNGPIETVLPRADQFCAEVDEQLAFGTSDLARWVLAVTGLDPI